MEETSFLSAPQLNCRLISRSDSSACACPSPCLLSAQRSLICVSLCLRAQYLLVSACFHLIS